MIPPSLAQNRELTSSSILPRTPVHQKDFAGDYNGKEGAVPFGMAEM